MGSSVGRGHHRSRVAVSRLSPCSPSSSPRAIVGIAAPLGQRHRDLTTDTRYESGLPRPARCRKRFSIEFYEIAVFFVVFDLEAVFIFAWAVALRQAGWRGYSEALIFIVLLLAGLVYLWRTGRPRLGHELPAAAQAPPGTLMTRPAPLRPPHRPAARRRGRGGDRAARRRQGGEREPRRPAARVAGRRRRPRPSTATPTTATTTPTPARHGRRRARAGRAGSGAAALRRQLLGLPRRSRPGR